MKKHELDKEKIFLIQNEAGEFINVEDPKVPYFASKLYMGSYASIKGKKGFDRNIEYLNGLGIYGKLSIYETTVYEHLASSASEISSSVIILDLAAKRLEIARDRIPNIPGANEQLRKSMLNTSGKMKFVHPIFKGCCEQNDDFTFENQGHYEAMILELAKFEMWEIEDLVKILRASRKNKKTMLGSAGRVNKKETV